jgi:hypothetical protein
MSTQHYVKHLRLVLPKHARWLGISAEAPVFISPIQGGTSFCRLCPAAYSPLVYQAGYEVTAHHLHRTGGGIYFYVLETDCAITPLADQYSWLAQVEPLGKWFLNRQGPTPIGRAAAVRVTQVTAWCRGRLHQRGRPPRGIRHAYHALTSGQLALHAEFGWPPLLLPVCDAITVPARTALFRFQIHDGVVSFQQRP